ncbi:alpha/beta fold hydrolase [Phaeovibrio sulfidiphilus]|uniref:Alpha/beta fold hydrolase n=1 Tax=Phaeovibrio sulfidiphilus TaxID=1220600 RepID=A0A8J7CQ54_9PROT|nr:alpha/beta fold hydrolase BchO [Phaeovibrio sulfidiphilus]MBE1236480.1 alpha/beta fold hydrolase [Phaeovibrio sulfidiphilus]
MAAPRSGPLDWAIDGKTWPNRDASSFVKASGLLWHVQRKGSGPTLLLLHGTGASTHSWRDLLGPLSEHFDVVALDLPGHGFTDPLPFHRLSLPGMAKAVAGLLQTLEVRPAFVVGHSAGVALALQMVLAGDIHPRGILSINGALKPYGGFMGPVFTGMAKMLFATPVVPWLATREAADPRRTRSVIQNTGSTLNPEGQALYDRLLRAPSHVEGALGMMASWNLHGLVRALRTVSVPILLVGSEKDLAVAPEIAETTAALMPKARALIVPGLGHLAHEENPSFFVDLIEREARRCGALPAACGP